MTLRVVLDQITTRNLCVSPATNGFLGLFSNVDLIKVDLSVKVGLPLSPLLLAALQSPLSTGGWTAREGVQPVPDPQPQVRHRGLQGHLPLLQRHHGPADPLAEGQPARYLETHRHADGPP